MRRQNPSRGAALSTRCWSEFGPISLQQRVAGGGVLGGREEPQDEDCLFLNIWTPGVDAARRPVLIWIHGGGFSAGSGSTAMYDGASLAHDHDVVVVTINYRLGALGFLSSPDFAGAPGDATANFGLWDMVQALTWVRDEIGAFGGDPSSVTIFGESAGGVAVNMLLASPVAVPLFHRAISQSGTIWPASPEQATETAERLFLELGLQEPTAEALRAIPAEEMAAASAKVDALGWASFSQNGPLDLPYRPVVDGHLLDRAPLDSLRVGVARDVPLLIGNNTGEMQLFPAILPGYGTVEDAELVPYLEAELAALGVDGAGQAERGVAIYREVLEHGEAPTASDIFFAIGTDATFRHAADQVALTQASVQPQVFKYLCDFQSPLLNAAVHAVDVPLLFGSFREDADLQRFVGTGPESESAAAIMQEAWASFARTGCPTIPSGPAWPEFENGARRTMILDSQPHVVEHPDRSRVAFWEQATARITTA